MTETTRFRSPSSTGRFRKLTFERLDVRLPLSAESFAADIASNDGADLIEVRLAASPVDGTSIDDGVFSLREGERFVVDVYVRASEAAFSAKDADREFYGIFQAKVDLQYDPEIVQPVFEEISHGNTFYGLTSGELDASGGVIRNLGGIDASNLGKALVGQSTLSRSETLLVSVPFSTLSAGDPAIVPSVGQNPESFLGVGLDAPIAPEDVAFQFDPLTILSPTPSDNAVDPLIVNVPPALPIIDIGGFDSGIESPSLLDDRLSSVGSDVDSIAVGDLIEGLRLSLDLPLPLLREGSESMESSRVQSEFLDGLARWPIQRLLSDVHADEFLLQVIARPGQSTSPLTGWSIYGLVRAQEDHELAERFWRRFDLELLDDEDTTSPMELHFRLYRMQLSEASDPLQQKTGRQKQKEETDVPSVLDLGFADISAWLLDASYHSWTEPEFSQPQRESSSPARVAIDAETAPVRWSPEADVAVAARLELVEETRVDPFAAHAELMRRFGAESLDRVDANTSIPNSDEASRGQDESG